MEWKNLDFLVIHSEYEWIMERFEIDKISLLDEKKIVGKKKYTVTRINCLTISKHGYGADKV